MGLLGDILKKKLPTGRQFQAKVGPGSLEKKLYEATREGALDNLGDNQELINQIGAKRQADIRSGHYTGDKRKSDIEKAFKNNKDLTKDDKKELKGILEYWGKGDQSVADTAPVKPAEPSAASKRAAEARARFKSEPMRDLPDFLKNRASVSVFKNPWSGSTSSGGLGGGISAGANQGKGFRKPTLLK